MPEKETTHLKLPYPTSAGEVKTGPKDFEELAVAVDSAVFEGKGVANSTSYGGMVSKLFATEYEASATRATQVTVTIAVTVAAEGTYRIEGVEFAAWGYAAGVGGAFSFIVPAGKKWSVTKTKGTATIESSYLPI